MAKQRYINTKFWSDGWIRRLNSLDRYLFLYLISNEHTNICGIYELPIETMAFESGIDENDLFKTMLPRLQPKIYYVNGWVIICNFPKHQESEKSPKIRRGIELALEDVPEDVHNRIDTLSIPYLYPSNYSNTNSNIYSEPKGSQNTIKNNKSQMNSFNNPYRSSEHSDNYEPVIDADTGEVVDKKPQTKKYPNAKKVFNLFGKYPKNWTINKTQLVSAENLFEERGMEQITKALRFYKENKDEKFCPTILSPYDLDSKWGKLIGFKKNESQ